MQSGHATGLPTQRNPVFVFVSRLPRHRVTNGAAIAYAWHARIVDREVTACCFYSSLLSLWHARIVRPLDGGRGGRDVRMLLRQRAPLARCGSLKIAHAAPPVGWLMLMLALVRLALSGVRWG